MREGEVNTGGNESQGQLELRYRRRIEEGLRNGVGGGLGNRNNRIGEGYETIIESMEKCGLNISYFIKRGIHCSVLIDRG